MMSDRKRRGVLSMWRYRLLLIAVIGVLAQAIMGLLSPQGYRYIAALKTCGKDRHIPHAPINGLFVADINFAQIDGRATQETHRNHQRVWYALDAGTGVWGLPTDDLVKIVLYTPEERWDYHAVSFRGKRYRRNLDFEKRYCQEMDCQIIWADGLDDFASQERKTQPIDVFEDAYTYREALTLFSDQRRMHVYASSSTSPSVSACLMDETLAKIFALAKNERRT